jgi:hypothetical protein
MEKSIITSITPSVAIGDGIFHGLKRNLSLVPRVDVLQFSYINRLHDWTLCKEELVVQLHQLHVNVTISAASMAAYVIII